MIRGNVFGSILVILFIMTAGTSDLVYASRVETSADAMEALTIKAKSKASHEVLQRLFGQPDQEFIVLYKQDPVSLARELESISDPKQRKKQKKLIFKELKNKVHKKFKASQMQVLTDYDLLPMDHVHSNSRETLVAFLNDENVAAIYEIEELLPNLAESLPLIGQPIVALNNHGGEGTTVVVLDTGVDYTIDPFNCTSPGEDGCPIIEAFDIAPDDGEMDDDDHGTNVSAIVLGVAPDTRLAVLDVFDGTGASNADVIAGINWAIDHQEQYNIVAMNLSLGSPYVSYYQCPGSYAYVPFYYARDANIIPVVSSGNDGSDDGLSSPACTPGAVSVGAVYDSSFGTFSSVVCDDVITSADQVTCWSNSCDRLDLLAPGSIINAAGITMSGTSQAAPHVSGAIAVLRAVDVCPLDSINQSVDRLKNTGTFVIDSKNGVQTPRIDLEAAVDEAVSDFMSAQRDALIALYNSTDGPNWTNRTNWLGPEGTECTWYGVSCDAGGNYMTAIDLHSNGLNGAIPPEIGNLRMLKYLYLDDNNLNGTVPAELGSIEKLIILNLSNNDFMGQLPGELIMLNGLTDNASDFRFNHLYTADADLLDFINNKQIGGDWVSFQTAGPVPDVINMPLALAEITLNAAFLEMGNIATSFDNSLTAPAGYIISSDPVFGTSVSPQAIDLIVSSGPSAGQETATDMIPDTGQVACYDDLGNKIPCPQPDGSFYGQDANYKINPPSFTKLDDLGNALPNSAVDWVMVRDNVTGLVWEVKTDDGSVHDRDNEYNLPDAQHIFIESLNADAFGGFSDWRRPEADELAAIVDRSQSDPSINLQFFPNTQSDYYITNTTDNSGRVRLISFHSGQNTSGVQNAAAFVRAVRGVNNGSSDYFALNGDDTVTDIHTGLMWQQTSSISLLDWEDALDYCENLTTGDYTDWRLPNINEFRSIVNYSYYEPAIDLSAFPYTSTGSYWSSTTSSGITYGAQEYAWRLQFNDWGYEGSTQKYITSSVRAVRGGQQEKDGCLKILSPKQGSQWDIGSVMPITIWDSQGIEGDFRIFISRQGGKEGTFETIADIPDNNGYYEWSVTGSSSFNCVIKVEPLSDPSKGSIMGSFAINPEMAAVPDVVSLTQAEAESALIATGLAVGNVTTACDFMIPAGSVVSSDPAAGTLVTLSSVVDIVVSTGICTDSYIVMPQLAAGLSYSVGLKSDGTVVASGWNTYGQCDVRNWTDIVQISAGYTHTAGLKRDGTVVALGYNEYGQCDLNGWVDIQQVAAGRKHTVGLKNDGTVVALGYNAFGQCNVTAWTDIIQVEAGYDFTLGLKSDGTVLAVGTNSQGQCNVSGWADIIKIATGAWHTIGLKSDGTVVAAGLNNFGQCDVSSWTDISLIADGNGTHTVGLKNDGTVVAVGNNQDGQCNVQGWSDIVHIAAGSGFTIGLKKDGTVLGVGANNYGQCIIGSWADISQVKAASQHTLGLKTDGTVIAIGSNSNGQCNVSGWADVVQITTAGLHSAGLKSDKTVVAAGYNSNGQCDVGSWTHIIQVTVGGYHTAGLQEDKTVLAIGKNDYGQCNVGSWTNIEQIAAGSSHTIGLKTDGTVVGVGRNSNGQCDVGSWADISHVTTRNHTVGLKSNGTVLATGDNGYSQCNVSGWTDIVGISVGDWHTVGLKNDGTVLAVGRNDDGRCDVSSWTDIIQVSAGHYHTVGLKSDGSFVVAGDNSYGQLNFYTWNLGNIELISQREALFALYNSMGGESWLNSLNWLGPEGTESTWFGVACDPVTGFVTGINLESNNLSGPVPPEISQFTYLQTLNLGFNQLSGTIPSEIGALINLGIIHLQNNHLSGTIPGELSNLTNLITNSSDFRNNHLYTSDIALRDFLNSKQIGGDWESYQGPPVPVVGGMLQADAEAAIIAAGHVIGIISNLCDDNVTAGHVILTNPEGGSCRPIGTAVDLSVASGPCTIVDRDGDGIPDHIEDATCTGSADADTDDDGIPDGVEDADQNGIKDPGETDPCNPDTDGDGIQDGMELGYTLADVGTDTNLAYFQPDLDPSSTTNPLLTDTDGDGFDDGVEDINHNGLMDAGESDPDNSSSVPVIMGDINNDGTVNLTDAIITLQVIAGIAPGEPIHANADVNGDFKIGIEEAVFIMTKAAGIF